MRIGFLFAWYDLWIGAYWDRKAHWLYLMIPMCGIILKFRPPDTQIRQHQGKWYVLGPPQYPRQMGDANATCHAAYTAAWLYHKYPTRLSEDK